MKVRGIAVLTFAAALTAAPAVFAAETKKAEAAESKKTEAKEVAKAANATADQAALQKEAKITMEKAREIALKRVPGGTIADGELEREHGKLVYSFDIKTSKPGVTEVQVSAITGKIVSVKQETPAAEAAEKKKEAAEKAKKH